MSLYWKYHRIAGTQSRVITKVHDLLGQPSYLKLYAAEKINILQTFKVLTRNVYLSVSIVFSNCKSLMYLTNDYVHIYILISNILSSNIGSLKLPIDAVSVYIL